MRLGLQISCFSWPGGPAAIAPTLGRIARSAEDAGLSSLWVMDHFWQIKMNGPPELDMLEGYTTLAYAAALTERIELGTLVTGVTNRHPGVLAKTVTTLDVLSGGRAWLGVGAAWYEAEMRGLGIPFPPVAERFERLEETLQICSAMFDGREEPHCGAHHTLERPLNSPPPLRRPPILIGGMGEEKTFRLVATYADACNLFDVGPEGVAAKLAVLRQRCAEAGRDPREIERTVLSRITLSERGGGSAGSGEATLSVGEAVDKLAGLARVGVDTVIIGMADAHQPEAWPRVAELVRRGSDLEPAPW